MVALAVLTAGGLCACTAQSRPASPSSATSPSPTSVEISVSHCGRGWLRGIPGRQAFEVRDTDSRPAEVTLVDPATGAVFAAVEPLGAGRSAAIGVDLGPGRYAFRCAMEDEDVVTGPSVRLAGPAASGGRTPARGVLPVTQQDLLAPTRAYERYVAGRLPGLARDVRRLQDDLRPGGELSHVDRAAAQRDWLTAHLDYERLGAAYGAFGAADAAINGLPSSRAEGLKDRDFTGFHRIEQDLWSGRSRVTLRSEVDRLVRDVAALRRQFDSAQIDPLEVSIRAHEITENALQLQLTGRTDFGSHSSLATVRANVDGTRTVVDLLTPLLRPRYAALPAVVHRLDRTADDLDRDHVGGRWVALQDLSTSARERIDSDVSELTELLAPIATICEPRRTS